MSTMLFSKSFLHKITAIIRKFWWIGKQEENRTNPIPYRSWEDICQSKDNGGLGIRDLETINRSFIIQADYNIAIEKNPMLKAVLKAKYFHNKSFWTANTNGPDLYFGHLSCRLGKSSPTMLLTRFKLATLPFGLPLGFPVGIPFMTTSDSLFLFYLCQLKCPTFG